MSDQPIRVVIADDHTLFRQALLKALHGVRSIEIVGEADDGLHAQEVAIDQLAQIVLMDIDMPIVNGIEACRQLSTNHPEMGVIVVSEHCSEGNVFQSLRAGAKGFLPKTCSVDDLVQAILAVVAGGTVLGPNVTGSVVSEFRRLWSKAGPSETDGFGSLTPTELRILGLVSNGLSNKEIAIKLSMAESTIKNRLSVMFDKMEVLDRTQAAIFGIRHGIVPERAA